MLRFYRALGGRLAETGEGNDVRFISAVAPSDAEVSRLSALLGTGGDRFHAALEADAAPRVEAVEGTVLVVCASPVAYRQGESMRFEVVPLSLVLSGRAAAVCSRENPAVGELVQGIGAAVNPNGRVVLQFMQILAARFARHLRQIEKITTYLEKKPGSARRNRKLRELLDLETALVHFSMAIRENETVLETLLRGRVLPLTEEERLLLEHVRAEMKRTGELAAAYSRLLDGTIGTLASIASNNLNRMLRVFSAVILLLAVLLAVFFVYGLQTPGFPKVGVFLVLALSAFCMSCGALALHRGHPDRSAS